MVFKDVTSILSMTPGTRGEIMAALGEVYDGHWVREAGVDGGRVPNGRAASGGRCRHHRLGPRTCRRRGDG